MEIHEARHKLIEQMAQNAHAGVWDALALLIRGGEPEAVRPLLESGLDDANMFTVPGYVRVYIKHRDAVPDDLAVRIAELLAEQTSYVGIYDSIHTENHKVMLATTRLLAAQALPDRRIDGVTATTAYRASLDWLRAWGESRFVNGHSEFHSSIYCMTYAMPLLNLRDCATDPAVRNMAEMMADYIAIHHAVSHLDGMYAGGHSRTYDPMAVHTRAHPSQAWAFLFYGADDLRYPPAATLAYTAAESDYVPHPAIIGAATDRGTPYAMRERFAEVSSNGVPVDIGRYTWMTDAFALSSLQGAAWPDHQSRWSLKIAAPDSHATVFTNHSRKAEKWGVSHGASEYEHLVQHEGTIIASYCIPDDDPYPLIHGHLPWHADEWSPDPDKFVAESPPQWLCFRTGGAYVALHPCSPFRIAPGRYEGGMFVDTDFEGEPFREFVSPHARNAVVLHVSRGADWPSFDAFVAAIRKTHPEFDAAGVGVWYRTVGGAELSLTNPGPDPDAESYTDPDGTISTEYSHLHYRAQRPRATFSVNGSDPDHRDWPSLESPFARSDAGSGLWRVERDGHGVELDFRQWRKRVW